MGDTAELCPGGRYRIGQRFGGGSFGVMHFGTDLESGEEVAVKLESLTAQQPQLLYEAKLYSVLAGEGLPRLHWHGVCGPYNVVVLELMGPTLTDLFEYCGQHFNLKTVLMCALQLLRLLESLHARSFLHRDITPQNFLIGLSSKAKYLHMIDLGLAKKYRDSEQQHIPERSAHFVGTPAYASVNAHAGLELSRRDDLESIAYLMLEWSRGQLPWDSHIRGGKGASAAIHDMKLIPIPELFHGLPSEFAEYLGYCRSLGFAEKPDYRYLLNLFQDLFLREGFKFDFVYQWTLLNPKQSQPPSESLGNRSTAASSPRESRAVGQRVQRTADANSDDAGSSASSDPHGTETVTESARAHSYISDDRQLHFK
jgi:casein kinase 1